MRGRSVSCLLVVLPLAILGLLLLPRWLRAQADRLPASPDLSRSDSPVIATLPPHPHPPLAPPGAPVAGVPSAVVPAEIVDFAKIARAAGMVFSGTVTGIVRHPADRAQATETVAIRFHVNEAIRGPRSGEDLDIRQWMGAWIAGQRYRVGERVFVFLYPPSKLGLTSSVSGAIGRFRVDGGGRIWLSAQQLSAFRKDPVLGGRSQVSFGDLARAVKRASVEQ